MKFRVACCDICGWALETVLGKQDLADTGLPLRGPMSPMKAWAWNQASLWVTVGNSPGTRKKQKRSEDFIERHVFGLG